MKLSKLIIRINQWIGRKSSCMAEKRKSYDKEVRPYIRPKRRPRMLPDSWDTKWINVRQFRSWKDRCKKRHQWERHCQSPEEVKIVTGRYPEDYIMRLYGHTDRWTVVENRHIEQVQELIEEGLLRGRYIYYKGHKEVTKDDGTKIIETRCVPYLRYARRMETGRNRPA